MSYYEERLSADRHAVDRRVADVGERVEAAQETALQALLEGDRELAYRTILADHPVNREIRTIEAACHAFVARHLPSAGHLRWVSSVLRLCVGLERVGDYASTICRAAVQLEVPVPEMLRSDLERMGTESQRVLRQAMRAWNQRDVDLARTTVDSARRAEGASKKVFADLLRAGDAGRESGELRRPLADLFALLVIFNRLDRVVAQAKNVCEETLFAVAGETKQPKVYRILVVDAGDDCWTQLAVAYGRRAFPESTAFSSAGWDPADAVDPRCLAFMDRRGLDGLGAEPRRLASGRRDLADAHVVVSLGGDLRSHVDRVPFQTVVLEWDVGPDLGTLDQERADTLLAQGLETLQDRLAALVETLRGGEG